MEKPLVSISCCTYNQEKYVRETVRGLLSQTYEPLEIVISDDHSTDRTWDIILDEVDAYKKVGGVHKNIVLNRNEKNLGIALHEQKKVSLLHGEFFVDNGGDDIPFPNRVERLVDVWLESDKTLDAIYSGAVTINFEGESVGELSERYFSKCYLGAAAAYSRRLIDLFPPITVKGAAEDTVYAKRTDMLGGKRLFLRENLLKYRVGSGVSTVTTNWRKPNLGWYTMDVSSYQQALIDLNLLNGKIDGALYAELKEKYENEIKASYDRIELIDGKKFLGRLNAYRRIRFHPWFCPGGICQLLCLLPARFGDPLLNLLAKIKYKMGR